MRAVKAGSKDEAGTTPMGAAHFIEHMSFRIQNGKIWSLASKGDIINAETNMDSTRFYVVHLPEQTEETIQIDSERFQSAAVPADKVPVEMKAVLNELERGEKAGNKMFRTTGAVAILEHPYHHSTIGTMTDVKKTSAVDMEHFRAKYYVPSNTTLIFVGAMHPETILKHVDTHFGGIPAGGQDKRVLTQEPQQLGMRYVELMLPAPCPMTCMAFRAPAGSKKESVVLKCISKLLYHNGEGRAKSLILDNTLHDVSTYSPRQLDPYLWFFHGTQETTSPESRLEVQQKMLSTLETFETHPVLTSELDNVKNVMLDEWNRSTESVQDLMAELGRGVSIGNWKDFQARKDALETITPNDIAMTAAIIFKSHNMTVTHVIPTKEPLHSSAGMPIESKVENISPSVVDIMLKQQNSDWKLQNIGPVTNLIHTPRANYVRTTLSARFSPADHDKASLLVSALREPDVSRDISSKLMSLHAERNFMHDHEFIHMNMALPSDNVLETGTAIVQEWHNSKFDRDNVELHKRHLISELLSRRTDQSYQVKKHFIQSLFEKTQYNIPLEARVQRIKEISMAELEEFHNQLTSNGSTYVTMIAPTTKVASELGKIFNSTGTPPKTTLEWTSLPRKATEIHQKLPGFGSASIMIGQTVDNSLTRQERVALKAAAEVLGGGMTGRLMHTVREQRGLGTYGIYAMIQTVSKATDPIFCVQGTFSPDSLEEGMATTRELIQEWKTSGITPRELENASSRMIGSRKIAMDDVDQLGSTLLKHILDGKDAVQELHIFDHIVSNLTVDFVNKTIQKYIDPNAFAEIIVGPV
jgi:zinc protease